MGIVVVIVCGRKRRVEDAEGVMHNLWDYTAPAFQDQLLEVAEDDEWAHETNYFRFFSHTPG